MTVVMYQWSNMRVRCLQLREGVPTKHSVMSCLFFFRPHPLSRNISLILGKGDSWYTQDEPY